MELLSKYLCCLQCCKKEKPKTRKEIREEWLKKNKKEEIPPPKVPINEPDDEELRLQLQTKASITLQRVARGFIHRRKVQKLWDQAIAEADDYWNYQLWLRDEENRRRLMLKLMREKVYF